MPKIIYSRKRKDENVRRRATQIAKTLTPVNINDVEITILRICELQKEDCFSFSASPTINRVKSIDDTYIHYNELRFANGIYKSVNRGNVGKRSREKVICYLQLLYYPDLYQLSLKTLKIKNEKE